VTGMTVLAAGGFAGSNAPGAAINNSYATGNVIGGQDGFFAGFVGANWRRHQQLARNRQCERR